MSGREWNSLLGKAKTCQCVARHSPAPARYVWHHVLPQVCGGVTTQSNLVSVCDNAHYAIHKLMYAMLVKDQHTINRIGRNDFFMKMAVSGYGLAVERGTESKIPKESEL